LNINLVVKNYTTLVWYSIVACAENPNACLTSASSLRVASLFFIELESAQVQWKSWIFR